LSQRHRTSLKYSGNGIVVQIPFEHLIQPRPGLGNELRVFVSRPVGCDAHRRRSSRLRCLRGRRTDDPNDGANLLSRHVSAIGRQHQRLSGWGGLRSIDLPRSYVSFRQLQTCHRVGRGQQWATYGRRPRCKKNGRPSTTLALLVNPTNPNAETLSRDLHAYAGQYTVEFPDHPNFFPNRVHRNDVDQIWAKLAVPSTPVSEAFFRASSGENCAAERSPPSVVAGVSPAPAVGRPHTDVALVVISVPVGRAHSDDRKAVTEEPVPGTNAIVEDNSAAAEPHGVNRSEATGPSHGHMTKPTATESTAMSHSAAARAHPNAPLVDRLERLGYRKATRDRIVGLFDAIEDLRHGRPVSPQIKAMLAAEEAAIQSAGDQIAAIAARGRQGGDP
jgi:hypothetical protein